MDYFRVEPAHETKDGVAILVTVEGKGVIIALEQAGKKIFMKLEDLEMLIDVLEIAKHTSNKIMKELLDQPLFKPERLEEIRNSFKKPHFNLDSEV
ncbi:hypothetical protein E6Q11_06470 [Candidatus Dojkabacteria bacterium]|uniref:Uncharacterized protein n=1 Tax=Candidatus Dojkabacteria bacterium TaxID=2099670 RepID=A0A5C7J2W0_9BACT|nr:MAG: hypothetical protein E6Q11_06470 [Candidatus Dojkabacteria bacterium]